MDTNSLLSSGSLEGARTPKISVGGVQLQNFFYRTAMPLQSVPKTLGRIHKRRLITTHASRNGAPFSLDGLGKLGKEALKVRRGLNFMNSAYAIALREGEQSRNNIISVHNDANSVSAFYQGLLAACDVLDTFQIKVALNKEKYNKPEAYRLCIEHACAVAFPRDPAYYEKKLYGESPAYRKLVSMEGRESKGLDLGNVVTTGRDACSDFANLMEQEIQRDGTSIGRRYPESVEQPYAIRTMASIIANTPYIDPEIPRWVGEDSYDIKEKMIGKALIPALLGSLDERLQINRPRLCYKSKGNVPGVNDYLKALQYSLFGEQSEEKFGAEHLRDDKLDKMYERFKEIAENTTYARPREGIAGEELSKVASESLGHFILHAGMSPADSFICTGAPSDVLNLVSGIGVVGELSRRYLLDVAEGCCKTRKGEELSTISRNVLKDIADKISERHLVVVPETLTSIKHIAQGISDMHDKCKKEVESYNKDMEDRPALKDRSSLEKKNYISRLCDKQNAMRLEIALDYVNVVQDSGNVFFQNDMLMKKLKKVQDKIEKEKIFGDNPVFKINVIQGSSSRRNSHLHLGRLPGNGRYTIEGINPLQIMLPPRVPGRMGTYEPAEEMLSGAIGAHRKFWGNDKTGNPQGIFAREWRQLVSREPVLTRIIGNLLLRAEDSKENSRAAALMGLSRNFHFPVFSKKESRFSLMDLKIKENEKQVFGITRQEVDKMLKCPIAASLIVDQLDCLAHVNIPRAVTLGVGKEAIKEEVAYNRAFTGFVASYLGLQGYLKEGVDVTNHDLKNKFVIDTCRALREKCDREIDKPDDRKTIATEIYSTLNLIPAGIYLRKKGDELFNETFKNWRAMLQEYLPVNGDYLPEINKKLVALDLWNSIAQDGNLLSSHSLRWSTHGEKSELVKAPDIKKLHSLNLEDLGKRVGLNDEALKALQPWRKGNSR